jgi:hypothetical protein
MQLRICLAFFSFLVLATCGEAPKNQPAGEKRPVAQTCTSPEQAGAKAAEITSKLVEYRKKSLMTDEEYARFNNMMSVAFKAWAETQDLAAYCSRLDKVATTAKLNAPTQATPSQGR